MTLDPFLQTLPQIQIHAAFGALALLLGPFVLWRRKRDRMHKSLGYVWVLAMGLCALGGLFIPSHFTPWGIGPIHALSIYALWGLFVAMRAIYRRNIREHREVMQNLYVRGVMLAGAFNFLPGRTTGRTTQRSLIPETPELGYVIIAVVLVWAFLPLVRRAFSAQPVAG